ncbi:MAG: transpeptidase family protein [Acidobacteria bacterium]|nr:transpeptidase family protein [Acidobacteriota bacterium]
MISRTPLHRNRVLIFMAVVLLWQLVILGRVFYIKVFETDSYRELARMQKDDLIQVPASRGRILDRSLEPLAVSVPLESVFIYTPNITDKAATAAALAAALKMDTDQILQKMEGELKFRYIRKYVPADVTRPLKQMNLAGVGFLDENKRIYPKGRLGAHVLGAITYRNGLEVGLEGLEKQYNHALSGSQGQLFLQKDGLSKILTTQVITASEPGQTLILNIDNQIQHIAERELLRVVTDNQARRGMIVVMEPDSGQILALAVWPDFDPNNLQRSSQASLRNWALEQYFEPGSTFKIITCSGVLEENLASPDEIIFCGNGYISLSGHIIRDHKPFGDLAFADILANSSDVGAIKLGLRMGEESLYRHIRMFGFGDKTGVDLPAEITGRLEPASRWSGISIGAISMGQEIGVNALQIVRAMGVIANGGFLVRPMVVNRILDDQGNLVREMSPERVRILSARTAGLIRNALVRTVEAGTGRRAAVPGYRVAGKTGTGQIFDPQLKTYSPTDFTASFIGFAPADNPAFVAGIIIEAPRPLYHGGEVAAPVFHHLAQEIFLLRRIEPTETTAPPELAQQKPPAGVPAPTASRASVAPLDDFLLDGMSGPRETVIALIPEDSFLMPDFSGKSLRHVIKECARMGLLLNPSGSGIAVEQIPPAGVRINPNTRCSVWFSNDTEKISQLLGIEIFSIPRERLTRNHGTISTETEKDRAERR